MSKNERLSPRQRDKGISFGFMAAIIPLAASILLEQIQFKAPEGVSITANHLAGEKSSFKNKEIIPTDIDSNSVLLPSGSTCRVRVGNNVYITHDFKRTKSALIKIGGRILRRGGKYGDYSYHMSGGKSIDISSRNRIRVLEDGSVVEWKP